MSQVWGLDLPDSEMLIMLALADWSNDDGECWPSIAQLVKKTRKGERTIQGAIKSMAKAGHLTREEKSGKGCTYTLHPRSDCAPAAAAPRSRRTPAKSAPPQPLPVTPAAAADNTSGHTISTKASPSPKKRAPAWRAFVPPSDIPETEWEGFEEMRKRIGKPMTDHARGLAVKRLRELAEAGHPPGDVLNHSILNNYQGLFPPKDDRNGNRLQRRMEAQPDLRGGRPDPALDLLRAARRAEEAAGTASGGADHRGTGTSLPAIPAS